MTHHFRSVGVTVERCLSVVSWADWSWRQPTFAVCAVSSARPSHSACMLYIRVDNTGGHMTDHRPGLYGLLAVGVRAMCTWQQVPSIIMGDRLGQCWPTLL